MQQPKPASSSCAGVFPSILCNYLDLTDPWAGHKLRDVMKNEFNKLLLLLAGNDPVEMGCL
jgi:hypothetical protein